MSKKHGQSSEGLTRREAVTGLAVAATTSGILLLDTGSIAAQESESKGAVGGASADRSWLIHNGIVITIDPEKRVIRGGAVAIEGGKITAVGSNDEVLKTHAALKRIDANGKAILPGFVNCHQHTNDTINRGIIEDAAGFRPDKPSNNMMHRKMAPIWEAMTPDDWVVMSRLGCLEPLKSGCTCIVDNTFAAGVLVPESLYPSGLRVVASQIIGDLDWTALRDRVYRYDPKIGERLLKEGVDLVEKWHGKDNGRITCQMSFGAADHATTDLIKEVKSAAEILDVGIHCHVAQGYNEIAEIQRREGMRPVAYLNSLGVLGPRTIAAHCVTVNEKEIEVLGSTGLNVASCAAAYARWAHMNPMAALRDAGANIVIGTDGYSGNMIENMRLVCMGARLLAKDDTIFLPMEILEMATLGGARAAGLEEEIGSIEVGKKADLIMIDLDKPHLVPTTDVVSNIVHYGLASDVDTLMVEGRILMASREVKAFDEDKVLADVRATSKNVFDKIRKKYGVENINDLSVYEDGGT